MIDEDGVVILLIYNFNYNIGWVMKWYGYGIILKIELLIVGNVCFRVVKIGEYCGNNLMIDCKVKDVYLFLEFNKFEY